MPAPITEFAALQQDWMMNVSFSQFGEDAILSHIFLYNHPISGGGFYIDVGAHHPRFLSNTAIMHAKGWRGINIDADPISIAALKAERPGDVCIHAGIGKTEDKLPFYRFEGGAVSTFDEQSYKSWANAGQKVAGIDLVDVAPLGRILEPFLISGQTVDYMNIDVEGHDVDALESYDFDRFAPKVISIEADSLDLHDPSSNRAFQLLTSRGYRLVSHAIITSIYML